MILNHSKKGIAIHTVIFLFPTPALPGSGSRVCSQPGGILNVGF